MPRARSCWATSWASDQESSSTREISTAVGTEREASARPCERMRETRRVTPTESPTPGKVRLPEEASDS